MIGKRLDEREPCERLIPHMTLVNDDSSVEGQETLGQYEGLGQQKDKL